MFDEWEGGDFVKDIIDFVYVWGICVFGCMDFSKVYCEVVDVYLEWVYVFFNGIW